MLGRLAQFSSMIQVTPCASRESGEQRGVAPQTTERSRNDAAQRHWKVFDDTSLCVWLPLTDIVPRACCDIQWSSQPSVVALVQICS